MRPSLKQLTYATVTLAIAAMVLPTFVTATKEPAVGSQLPIENTTVAQHELAQLQTMPLLSYTPPRARGGSDISIDDTALLANARVGASEIAPKGSSEIRVYTVREGDTLSRVGDMFGVTSNTILWANDLPRATQIRPGDTLIILPIAGVQHTVASGDTIDAIAKQYNGDAEEILQYNELGEDAELALGDTLIIPGGTVRSVQARAASAVPVQINGSTAQVSGGLVHPVPGAVRTQGLHGQNAIDFAAGHGATIRAAAAGEVIVSRSSGWNGGYGQYIVIRHNNGTQTLYAHLSSNYVGVGAYVAQGEAIGGMGNTGRSTGTHLHFEVRGGRNPF